MFLQTTISNLSKEASNDNSNSIDKIFESAIANEELTDLEQVDLNTQDIYDYFESDNFHFLVNQNDSSSDRALKRKLAIESILELKDANNFIFSKSFMNSVRYLVVNKDKERFETFHETFEKEQLLDILIEFIELNYIFVTLEIQKSNQKELTLSEQSEILKRMFFINYLFESFFAYFSLYSYEFNLILIEKTKFISLCYQVLHNESIQKFLKNSQIICDYSLKVIDSLIDILTRVCYFFNKFKPKFELFNSQCFYNLILSLKELYGIDKSIKILRIIPFVLHYEDDEEQRTNELLREIYDHRKFENTIDTLFNINAEDILKSRKALFICQIDFLKITDIMKCGEEYIKKFINLTVDFIRQTHVSLIEDLKYFKPQKIKYQFIIFQIMLKCNALFSFIKSIENMSDTSIEFCIKYQKESENGVKAIFNFISDEFLIQTMLNNKENFIITFINDCNYNQLFHSIFNLSKAHNKFKEQWTNLNAFITLFNLSKRYQKIKVKNSDDFALLSIMTISNIASDDELNKLSVAPNLLMNLIQKLEKFSNVLAAKSKFLEIINIKNEPKRESYQIEESEQNVELLEDDDGFNIFECIQALYKFAINDRFKNSIYETFNLKPILIKIMTYGNSSEQEYSFKLLNQLCFDKKIALDIGTDSETVNLMKDIQANSETVNKNLLKYVNGVMWLVNEENKERKTTTEELKHVFISYNAGSRKTCLQIKTFLESLGHKVWIDTEDIHGSSIDAMAKGIEASWCVLICMSSKYKESNNCRSEAEYVMQIKKPFIPLIMEKSYKPDGW